MILSLLMEDKEIAFSKVRKAGGEGGREGGERDEWVRSLASSL